jgi:hypothetical protein
MVYAVHKRTCHQVDATPFATASMYVSLDKVNWNIMIPANVKKTRTQHVIATFHLHMESNPDKSDDVDSFGNYIKTLKDHIKRLLMHVKFVPGDEAMLTHS